MVKIIFMIDDDEDDREIFREALLKCNPNLDVLFARDGVEALHLLKSMVKLPDVIFLDYNMPQMNGMECLKILKERAETMHIPVAMYMASGDREEEKVLMLLGASYCMQKTSNFDQLCAELNRLLKNIGEKKYLPMRMIMESKNIIRQSERSVKESRKIIDSTKALISDSIDLLRKKNDLF